MVENRALRGSWGPQQNENLQLFFNSPPFFHRGGPFGGKFPGQRKKAHGRAFS